MPSTKSAYHLIALLLALPPLQAQAAEPPKVLASIKPLHSLAATIMAGVGQPDLLMRATASSHTYTLRPSDARAIGQADVIFWIGPAYESFMAKAVSGAPRAKMVAMSGLSDIRLLPLREGGVWATHDETGHDHRHGQGQDKAEQDMHLWLDTANAQGIARAMAEALSTVDPANSASYRANTANLVERIASLDRELKATLAPVAHKPYVVFHDAYQYFERRYDLTPVGAITVTPDRVPGPRRLSELRRAIGERKATCVFGEPQFTSSLVATVVGGTGARIGTLDALGATAAEGGEAYFTTLRGLAGSLADCLGKD